MQNKKKYILAAGMVAGALSIGLLGATTLGTALAASNTPSHNRGMHQGMGFGQNVQRSVTNISNGIQITMTSTDDATVTKLQARQMPTPPSSSNISVSQTNISNGVQITVTSTDAATVTKLQSGKGFGFGGRGGPGMGAQGGMFGQNVQRSVTNITNGIQMTLTSTDAATVTKLQARKAPTPPASSNVTVTQTNITNGVQITMTSTDAATVTKLQSGAAQGQGFGFGFGRGNKGPGMGAQGGMFGQNVQRSVTNITNGIQMTLTSTDAATVTKLQARKAPTPPASANVTVTQTNITNGIQITVTSTDAATVTKLQSGAAQGQGFGFGFGGRGGHKFGHSTNSPSATTPSTNS